MNLIHTKPTRETMAAWVASVRQLTMRHKGRFVRFGLVGASGVLVNTVLLYVLTETGGLHTLIAAVTATETAILSNFLLNDRWTFQEATPSCSWTRRAFRYNCGALAGLVISVGVLVLLTHLGMYYLVANLFAIAVAMVWNYAISCLFTWSTQEIDADAHSVHWP